MKRLLILVLLLSWTTSLKAQEQGVFKDTLDGAFDVSHFLFDLHGFLPIVSPITEPAVGYGAVLMNAFFIPKKGESERLFRMPDVAFGGGGLTENGTWFLGGGYLGFWNEDRVRYRGFAGYGSINLTYYAFSELLDRELAIEYNLASTFLHQEANWRIGETDLFIGGSYRFVRTRVSSDRDPEDLIPSVDREITTSGLGAQIQYDHRDNVFSPTSGFITSLSMTYYPDELGSTRDYGQLIWYLNYYIPIGSKWISGFRAQSNWAVADPPFYALPYIELRGVPNLRYQGDWIGLVETEQQFRMTRRWALLGFAGYGWAQSSESLTRSDATAWNAGGGFRYLLARAFGLQAGVDVARGPEQWAFYVVVGSSWGR
ncbi:BamA/TamA family outer membrane protein [Cryomorphaceae bacterium]|nr:BamA/TamA family outer membrane protein [Cryomorphaceae bacterium]